MLPKKALIVVFLIFFLFSLTIRSNKVAAIGGFIINQPTYGSTITPQVYPISITVINPLIRKLQLNWWDTRSTTAACSNYTVNVNVTVWNTPTIVSWDSGKVVNATYGMSVYGLDQNSNQIDASGVGNILVSNSGGDGPVCGSPDVPSILAFSSDRTLISPGQAAELSWNGTNAASCEKVNGADTTINPPPLNSFSGKSTTGPLNQTTTFKLTCKNSAGNSSFREVTVNVSSGSSPPPSPSGTQPNPPSGSSTSPPNSMNTSAPTTTTTSGEKIISPKTVTEQTLASKDKIVIEEEIPVSISEFNPDVFLKGNNIKLTSIKNVKQGSASIIRFDGKTKPNTLVTLYIFSNPIIVTIKSDANGGWYYERDKKIETGKHTAFATIYDDGVTRRSDVTSFFVAKNSLGDLVLKKTTLDQIYFYGLTLGGVIAVAILILVMYRIYLSHRTQKV